jgi:Fur family ferric uptake transcriptional regulator
MTPQNEPSKTERLQQQIRNAGLRCTNARLAVLRVLTNAESPLTHAEVAERLSNRGLDKATVFRNLVDLVDAQLLSRTELGDHVWRFEIRSPDAHTGEHHPHFICLDCGGVTCLAELDFDKKSQQAASSVGDVKEILIKGICLDCRPSA